MGKMAKLCGIVLMALLMLGTSACLGYTPASRAMAAVDSPAPDFSLHTLDGQLVQLSSFKGKPVLLNFWATWCPPCQSEMPYMQQVHDAWTPKGLVMLNVDVGETPVAIQSFLTQHKLSLTVPVDSTQSVSNTYSITGIPTTFFIDKSGIIRQKTVGAFPSKEAIESELSSIVR